MLRDLTNIASALSDPSRSRLLAAVIDPPSPSGEICVCELTDLLELASSTVSRHLSILREAGLIEGRKRGRWVYYRVADARSARQVADVIEWVRSAKTRDKQLLRDAARLREIVRSSGSACCAAESPLGHGDTGRPLRVLFLCTGNSCRSQMAEGWARHLLPGVIEAHSAGAAPKGLDPRAVRVMREAGVDIATQTSKRPEDIGVSFDVVVTVCDAAREACPVLPGVPRTIHAGFDDPPRLAAGARSDEEATAHYRRVRDEIREFVRRLPEILNARPDAAMEPAQGARA